MKSIGFFGLCHDSTVAKQVLLRNCGKMQIENSCEILGYLREGKIKGMIMGFVPDLLSESKIRIPASILTDGEWCWTEDLIYYVEKYNLRLSEEFVRHMKKNEWKVPMVDVKVKTEFEYTQTPADFGMT